jgi:hypothetical protein
MLQDTNRIDRVIVHRTGTHPDIKKMANLRARSEYHNRKHFTILSTF